MQRYFAQIKQNKVILEKDDENHVLHVMRNKVGDCIEVVSDNQLYLCLISKIKPLEIEVVKHVDSENTSKDVTLF